MKQTLLQLWQGQWPEIRAAKPLAMGEGVIDDGVFSTIEVDKIFDAVNYAETVIGQAVLYRSLAQPLAVLDSIQAKQDAVLELLAKPELKAAIDGLVAHAASQENDFYRLLFGKFLSAFEPVREANEIEGYGYLRYKRGIRFMLELVANVQAMPQPETPYLKGLFAAIKNFADSRSYSLMKGPVYITENGLQCKEERRNSLMPAIIFKPSILKPLLLALAVAGYGLVKHFAPDLIAGIPSVAVFFSPLLLLYFPIVGSFDKENCINPLRLLFKQSAAVGEALDALGQLDELLSILKCAENFGHEMVLPTLVDADHHRINIVGAKNPILAKENPDYVGNELALDDEKLVLVTGPNSGGKTAFCKTITQVQLLAQIGAFVPAKAATLTVADRIFYQVPEISQLNDGDGRFGTELKRTKDIFLACSPKSLVVLDELSEGTTFEEKMESSQNVLNGFYRKGNSTILITHNHQLVDVFVKQGIGLDRQVEFADDLPTHRIIPGISRISHADRVAKKIGFSKEDIDHYLKDG